MNRVPPGAPVVRAATMRAAEATAFAGGMSQDELMERAGIAVAREVLRVAMGRPVLVLAGPGNNGGDAFVVAHHCREWGLDVAVAAPGAAIDGAATRMRARWTGPVVPLAEAVPRPVLVDGLFGTGLSRPIDAAVATTLTRLAADAFVVAIDVPSGCDADAVEPFDPPFAADVTVALGALKPVHVVGASAARCGIVRLADLGIPIPADATTIARPIIAPPPRDAHKYTRGLVGVLAGAMPGAARLAARAALSAGAGYVVLAGDDAGQGCPDALVRRSVAGDDALAELVGHDRLAALLVGPGLGRDGVAERLLDAAIGTDAPLILDGDALTLLGAGGVARVASRTAPTFLTPHAGEFARMFPHGTGTKIDRTRAAAGQARATVLYKGPDTVIASPDGRAVVAASGPTWLSTAGTGDVLAGILAARIRPGGDAAPEQAVWLHSRAARLAGPAFVADDLIAHLGRAIGECR